MNIWGTTLEQDVIVTTFFSWSRGTSVVTKSQTRSSWFYSDFVEHYNFSYLYENFCFSTPVQFPYVLGWTSSRKESGTPYDTFLWYLTHRLFVVFKWRVSRVPTLQILVPWLSKPQTTTVFYVFSRDPRKFIPAISVNTPEGR